MRSLNSSVWQRTKTFLPAILYSGIVALSCQSPGLTEPLAQSQTTLSDSAPILPVQAPTAGVDSDSDLERANSSTALSASTTRQASDEPPEPAEPKQPELEAGVDGWTRYYNAGLKLLQMHMYEEAEAKLLASIKEAKKGRDSGRDLIYSRNALAEVELAHDSYNQALHTFMANLQTSKKVLGKDSEASGKAAYGVALAYFNEREYAKAQPFCKEALAIQKKVQPGNQRDLGKTSILMGEILGNQGWADEAEPFIGRGLWMVEKSPGYKQLEYADALRMVALYRQSRGQRQEAQNIFSKSNKILEAATDFTKPSKLAGLVRVRWEPGSPISQEIFDEDFPVRYINVNGVRVAATIVDLWELMGVLVCVTDTSAQSEELGLGKVTLDETSDAPPDFRKVKLTYVNPESIDRIRRERVMWDLTYTRPWLANMQKTRSTRGFVPSQGHDLFRGPNIFGVYGDWRAVQRVLPERIAAMPSPERVGYQSEHEMDSGLERSNNIKILGLQPVPLEPFESRTGELFYINPRCEHVLLTVQIGNTSFEIPFNLKRKRIN